MGSRTWIKIYCDKWLNGTIREESLEVRAVWVDLLVLAGSGKYGDIGEIKITEEIGFLDRQLADLLQISTRKWADIKKKLIKTERISVGKKNVIGITNWKNYQSEYERQKVQRHSSPASRINYSIGVAIYNSLKHAKDGRPWESLVGYTRHELVDYLESQFTDGMTWENYGDWHIDHIIPQSSFEFSSPDDAEFKRCWALTNLQPLWAEDNLKKGAKQGAVKGASRERDYRIETIDSRLENKEKTKQKESSVQFSKSIEEVLLAYQENVLLGATIPEDMHDEITRACNRYSPDRVIDAIKEACRANHLNWGYIFGILRNWGKSGKKVG